MLARPSQLDSRHVDIRHVDSGQLTSDMWTVDSGHQTFVDSGQWTVDIRHMDSGQWTVDSGLDILRLTQCTALYTVPNCC